MHCFSSRLYGLRNYRKKLDGALTRKRACGTARKVWNWAPEERNKQYAAGGKPNAMAPKKQFNALKCTDPQWLDENGWPWLNSIHRDARAQPVAHLARAWNRFFSDIRAGKQAHEPQFKKKGRVLGATVSRTAGSLQYRSRCPMHSSIAVGLRTGSTASTSGRRRCRAEGSRVGGKGGDEAAGNRPVSMRSLANMTVLAGSRLSKRTRAGRVANP